MFWRWVWLAFIVADVAFIVFAIWVGIEQWRCFRLWDTLRKDEREYRRKYGE